MCKKFYSYYVHAQLHFTLFKKMSKIKPEVDKCTEQSARDQCVAIQSRTRVLFQIKNRERVKFEELLGKSQNLNNTRIFRKTQVELDNWLLFTETFFYVLCI